MKGGYKMLVVKNPKSNSVFNVYEASKANSPQHSGYIPIFLLYSINYQDMCCKDFHWFFADDFKPYCKELFKIRKILDKRVISKVYAVHRDRKDPSVRYLIYKNKTWSWVYAYEYEIIPSSQIK